MPYLFLSYAKADRDSAFAMREVLQKEGFLVWMDEHETEPQNYQWKIIQAAISQASAVVLLMSDAAKKSAWLKRELVFAQETQKLILPILLEGEAWDGFAEKAIPITIGLRLDIPDERIAEIKSLLINQADSPLPPPLPDATLEAQAQKRLLLWFGIIALLLIVAIRLGMYSYGENLKHQESATNAVNTREQRQLTTRESQQMATETQRAVAESIGTRSALSRAATEYYQSHMASTAQAGNGLLPCGASIRVADGSSNVQIYVRPSFNSSSWLRGGTLFVDRRMLVTEWVLNDDGVWYRIATESQQNLGYLRAENLLLDDDCPR